jgi:hypothetical protein
LHINWMEGIICVKTMIESTWVWCILEPNI